LRLTGEITDETEWGEENTLPRDYQYAEEAFDFQFISGYDGISEEVFEQALGVFVEAHPGRRPEWWWKPKLRPGPTAWWSRLHATEPRRQVSGRMVKRWHRSANQTPSSWADRLPNLEWGFWHDEPDPDDPPRYESEAAFLERLGVLLPGERELLKPADFLPEVMT
jgi:hypothetical protein